MRRSWPWRWTRSARWGSAPTRFGPGSRTGDSWPRCSGAPGWPRRASPPPTRSSTRWSGSPGSALPPGSSRRPAWPPRRRTRWWPSSTRPGSMPCVRPSAPTRRWPRRSTGSPSSWASWTTWASATSWSSTWPSCGGSPTTRASCSRFLTAPGSSGPSAGAGATTASWSLWEATRSPPWDLAWATSSSRSFSRTGGSRRSFRARWTGSWAPSRPGSAPWPGRSPRHSGAAAMPWSPPSGSRRSASSSSPPPPRGRAA